MSYYIVSNELYHHGILGQKWGIRRYQNPDGSLTAEGQARYNRQSKEREILNRSQKNFKPLLIGSGIYERSQAYYNASQAIRSKSQELKGLADKISDLSFEIDDYAYDHNKEIRDLAFNNCSKDIKKDYKQLIDIEGVPEESARGENLWGKVCDYYLYEKGEMEKAQDQYLKNDKRYKALKSEYRKSIKEYKSAVREAVNDVIGEFGEEKISNLNKFSNPITFKELASYAIQKPHLIPTFDEDDYRGNK